jgi:hypothetical protein
MTDDLSQNIAINSQILNDSQITTKAEIDHFLQFSKNIAPNKMI